MEVHELEALIQQRFDAMPKAARAELLRVLMLPDFERADRIGESWSYPQKPRLRGAPDRCGGGPNRPGSAGRDAAGTLVNGEIVKIVAWLAHEGSSYAS